MRKQNTDELRIATEDPPWNKKKTSRGLNQFYSRETSVLTADAAPNNKHNCGKHITKTYLYNFHPLKPNFYIEKLGFTGVYIIFLISAQNHRLWVLVRTASPRRFQRVPTIYVLSRNVKNIRIFHLHIFIFWW